MQYFTMQANSLKDALDKMNKQYGSRARMLTHRDIKIGGIMGLFSKDGVEVTGYLSSEAPKKIEIEEEKKKLLENMKREQTVQLILKEIQGLKTSINRVDNNQVSANPNIGKIEEFLRKNDFTYDFIKDMTAVIRSRFSLEELNDLNLLFKNVVQWIGEKITLYPAFHITDVKPVIHIVIGPTGVGKTTTIAKLAAIYGIGSKKNPALKVRMITIDSYRIAAKKQIETYGEIMQIPVSFAESFNELEKVILQNQDADLILIDTIGKSPSDYEKLAEMKKMLAACGAFCETHLAISSTTKASDIEDIMQQFEPFNYKAVILTKLDETSKIGSAISVLAKKNKPVSYLTDGQKVPQDIEEATIVRLLMKLEGVRIDREFIEEKFGKKDKLITNYWR